MSGPDVGVAYRDERLAVIDKPAGLVVHAAPGARGPTLVDLLGDVLGGGEDPGRPGIVHRLDKDTSGLMLVARDDEAHRLLAAQIKDARGEQGLPGARGRRSTARARGRSMHRSGATTGHPSAAPSGVGGRGPR